MKKKAFVGFSVIIVLLIFFIPSVSAVNIGEGTIFKTTSSNCSYYMANDFIFDPVTTYPTSLYFSSGNITTYPSTGWINISIEDLETTIDFTNNVTMANLTIDNGFADFTIVNGVTYDIRYQSNNMVFQHAIASEDKIVLTNVPSGSWQIYIAPPTMKEILIEKHVETTETSYALLGILGIVFLVVFILYILFSIQNGEEVSFIAILIGFVSLLGFFILLYIMLPLFDAIIDAMG